MIEGSLNAMKINKLIILKNDEVMSEEERRWTNRVTEKLRSLASHYLLNDYRGGGGDFLNDDRSWLFYVGCSGN